MVIPEFTDDERDLAIELLLERYSRLVPLQLAEAELQLDPDSQTLTACPALYWRAREADFIIFKLGDSRYRCQFFYSELEQFGTGREEYKDFSECIITLLQVQADHEKTRVGAHSGATGADLVEEEYFGPTLL
ncbi:MAG: hypothetical protein KGK17_03830 [Betaproteobacteria bacterium]|nr:hypothetical protein [Betaproteobacteria bacterium]